MFGWLEADRIIGSWLPNKASGAATQSVILVETHSHARTGLVGRADQSHRLSLNARPGHIKSTFARRADRRLGERDLQLLSCVVAFAGCPEARINIRSGLPGQCPD